MNKKFMINQIRSLHVTQRWFERIINIDSCIWVVVEEDLVWEGDLSEKKRCLLSVNGGYWRHVGIHRQWPEGRQGYMTKKLIWELVWSVVMTPEGWGVYHLWLEGLLVMVYGPQHVFSISHPSHTTKLTVSIHLTQIPLPTLNPLRRRPSARIFPLQLLA